MATSAEERLKHSIIYEESTSEIKDDVVQLVACLVGKFATLRGSESAPLINFCTVQKSNTGAVGRVGTSHACGCRLPCKRLSSDGAALNEHENFSHPRQQSAAFLLWYHALSGEDKQAELAAANVINICMTLIDSPDSTPVDKSCCAGMASAKIPASLNPHLVKTQCSRN